jgi:hypothetical protein
MKFSCRDEPVHRRHAPLLGEHNAELLGALGLTEADIAELESEGVIGRTPVGADPSAAHPSGANPSGARPTTGSDATSR